MIHNMPRWVKISTVAIIAAGVMAVGGVALAAHSETNEREVSYLRSIRASGVNAGLSDDELLSKGYEVCTQMGDPAAELPYMGTPANLSIMLNAGSFLCPEHKRLVTAMTALVLQSNI